MQVARPAAPIAVPGVFGQAPLAYMRGRTLNNAFVLLDEAQNTTPSQIKMFLTRMGPTAKVMVNGDRSQVDLPTRQKSGLMQALDILRNVQGIGYVEMTSEDVVRHRLVKDIVEAYDQYDNEEMTRQALQNGNSSPRRDERHERRLRDMQPEAELPVNHGQAL